MNTLELLDKKEQLKQRAEEIVSKAEKETRRLNEGEHAERQRKPSCKFPPK